MEFFESWFDLSPDGGDGSLEVAFLVITGVLGAGTVLSGWLWNHSRGKERASVDQPLNAVAP